MELLFFLTLVGGGGYYLYQRFLQRQIPQTLEEAKASVDHRTAQGSARWRRPDETPNPSNPAHGLFFGQLQEEHIKGTLGKTDKYMGIIRKVDRTWSVGGRTGEDLYALPENNSLICAPAGSGKGTLVIIPTLAKIQQSIFTIDPKGENTCVTAQERKQLGQTVHVINPWNLWPEQLKDFPPASMNPLDLLNPDDPSFVSNGTFLADLCMMHSPQAAEAFWDDTARSVLRGLILYVALTEPPEQRHLPRVRELLTVSEKEFDGILQRMGDPDYNRYTVMGQTARYLLTMDGKTRSNVLTTAQTHTDFLNDPLVQASLKKSDFSFAELKQEPTSVYVIIPSYELETQGRWLRLMVGMALTEMERGEKFKNRCLFLLDEFAALGRMEKIRSGVALHRGYGVDYGIVVQDLNQLETLYDRGWPTILANCRYKYFRRISDLKTAEYVSKVLGHETVAQSDLARKDGEFSVSGLRQVPKPLLPVEECFQFSRGLLIETGAHSVMLNQTPYFERSDLRHLANRNPMHQ